MDSQITTGQGDGGESRALDGQCYPKHHPIMVCVGGLAESQAHVALLRQRILEERPAASDCATFLRWVLERLFTVGVVCSDPAGRRPERHARNLTEADLAKLEDEQARLETTTPLPHAFIVGASNSLAAQADVACTVLRRFERSLCALAAETPGFDGGGTLPFVNRLSDYLYMLARSLEEGRHDTLDTTRGKDGWND